MFTHLAVPSPHGFEEPPREITSRRSTATQHLVQIAEYGPSQRCRQATSLVAAYRISTSPLAYARVAAATLPPSPSHCFIFKLYRLLYGVQASKISMSRSASGVSRQHTLHR